MKCQIPLTFTLMLMTLLSGCGGDTRQSLADESMAIMRELNTTLEGIKDEATANSSKAKLKSLMEKMKAINDKQAKLPMPTEAEMKELTTKYGTEMEELQKKMIGHMMRLGFDPKIRPILDEIDMKSMK